MATRARPSSFLPSIKCSNCNAEIEISRMGDHLCSSSPEAADSQPWLHQDMAPSPEPIEYHDPPPPRSGRMPPSRIDSNAANRPFMRNNSLAPSSQSSGSRGASPLSPVDDRTSPVRQPMRSATSPLPQHSRLPSTGLSNLGCAFPPFPKSPATGHGTPTGTRTEPKNRFETSGDHDFDESSPMYKPMSPKLNGGGNVLQRMNTIVPGPFGVGGRRNGDPDGAAGTTAGGGLHRAMTSRDYTTPPSATASHFDHFRRPSTAESERSQASSEGKDLGSKSHRRAPTLANGTMASRPGTPKVAAFRKASIASDATEASYDSFRMEARSQTLPLESASREPSEAARSPLTRRPSEPSTRFKPPLPTFPSGSLPETGSPLSSDARGNPRSAGRNKITNDSIGSRSQSGNRVGLEREAKFEDAPPLPSTSHPHHAPRMHHTPTESQSSNGSGYGSEARTTSSRSTPPLPDPSDKALRRRPASPGSGASNRSARDDLRDLKDFNQKKRRGDSPGSIDKPLPNRPRDQPTDVRRQQNAPGSRSDPQKDLTGMGAYSRRTADETDRGPSAKRAEIPPTGRRPTPASKGNCRGCGEPIRGKSVSSADGRLTGRYHKQCFVCRTCKQPFETATFYVIENQPYCERHYHQLNDSICHSCDLGIEGQYLATEEQQKFHPGCFKCSDCLQTLRDEYFEMNGKAYCQRHAMRRTEKSSLLGPGRRNPERRTTRMMMI